MKKDVQSLIKNLNTKYKQRKIWKKVVGLLSCIAIFLTIYSLMSPAITETTNTYTFSLIDSFDTTTDPSYSWKIDGNYTTSYDLKLHYVDLNGNYIEGKDLTLTLGENTGYGNTPYGFGYVPKTKDGNGEVGANLIDAFNLNNLTNANGDKYIFDHMEVLVGSEWKSFVANSGIHWNLWCYNANLKTKPEGEDIYGWRGQYEVPTTTNGTTTYEAASYTINAQTEYKIVYKLVLKGNDSVISSVGLDSGIAFKIYNYDGDNSETGVNANGLYNYFTFRGSNKGTASGKINQDIDADGFTSKRAKVEKNLDSTGNPVFDCQGKCDNDTSLVNTSLGYLFGNDKNALGTDTEGVHKYNPNNTPLLKKIDSTTGIEYYSYDSNINAVDYDIENARFLLRNYNERSHKMTTYNNSGNRYEFLPFNYWDGATHTGDNSRPYQHEYENVDLWYGMTMEFDFYMPKNGILTGTNNSNTAMKFEFSGDDDVWVFIDGVLVLDLGGTHGSVDGSIDFSTGKVEGYLNWEGSTGTKNKTTIYDAFVKAGKEDEIEWNDAKTTFKDFSEHTLKFFYLERGGSVANCKIKFNMPVLPPGSLWVQKDYEGTVKYPEEQHEFTLYKITETEIGASTANTVPGTKYTIGGKEYTTTNDGKFYLKVGEVAIFELNNYESYFVEETKPGTYSLASSCTLNDKICTLENGEISISKSNRFTIAPDTMQKVIFTNKIKTFNLTVFKEVKYAETAENFEFAVRLVDEKGSPVNIPDDINSPQGYIVNHEKGIVTFTLKNNNNITIKDIPINTNVTLQETKHDGYQTIIKSGDITLANGDIYVIEGITSDKNITVQNIPGVELPETGGAGILMYLLIGASLMLVSLKYGYSYFFKLKEGEE